MLVCIGGTNTNKDKPREGEKEEWVVVFRRGGLSYWALTAGHFTSFLFFLK